MFEIFFIITNTMYFLYIIIIIIIYPQTLYEQSEEPDTKNASFGDNATH